MTFTQYETKFVDLSHNAVVLIPTERERVRRLIDCLTFGIRLQMARKTEDGISFNQVVEISRWIERVHGMYWLSPYHAILDCHAKIVTLAMLGFSGLEWRWTPGYSTIRVISYVKARHMVEKVCLAYLAYICDPSAEVPSMGSVPVVHEFPKVFPTDLSGMPLDRDIDFCIDLVSGTQPISTALYHLAPVELKELKEQL
ncbi:uncharacterized protein [Nicotiana tomentosiformis]|uniref:uncharacterized protein n=1 Tax=Nicotiana tomentosiformis TaxID=4098 RepID=UPI00388CD66D